MHVAKYWRSKKLRYQLFTTTEGKGNGRVKPRVEAQVNRARELLPAVKRAKAAS